MAYAEDFRKEAKRQLAKLPLRIQEQIAACIDYLADGPRPDGCRKLSGYEGIYCRISRHLPVKYSVCMY